MFTSPALRHSPRRPLDGSIPATPSPSLCLSRSLSRSRSLCLVLLLALALVLSLSLTPLAPSRNADAFLATTVTTTWRLVDASGRRARSSEERPHHISRGSVASSPPHRFAALDQRIMDGPVATIAPLKHRPVSASDATPGSRGSVHASEDDDAAWTARSQPGPAALLAAWLAQAGMLAWTLIGATCVAACAALVDCARGDVSLHVRRRAARGGRDERAASRCASRCMRGARRAAVVVVALALGVSLAAAMFRPAPPSGDNPRSSARRRHRYALASIGATATATERGAGGDHDKGVRRRRDRADDASDEGEDEDASDEDKDEDEHQDAVDEDEERLNEDDETSERDGPTTATTSAALAERSARRRLGEHSIVCGHTLVIGYFERLRAIINPHQHGDPHANVRWLPECVRPRGSRLFPPVRATVTARGLTRHRQILPHSRRAVPTDSQVRCRVAHVPPRTAPRAWRRASRHHGGAGGARARRGDRLYRRGRDRERARSNAGGRY